MKHLLVMTLTLGSALSAYAQNINLSKRVHVPLYDCSIFRDRSDRNDCMALTQGRDYDYNRGGDAVNCREEFVRNDRSTCMDLADRLTYDGSAFDCYPLSRNLQRKCEDTKNAYQDGFISGSISVRPMPMPAPAPAPVIVRSSGSCSQDSYDRSYSRWMEMKEKQSKRGAKRTIFGVAAILGGAVLGSSNNGVTRAVGNTMMIGGAVVTAMGLIDMADADMSMYSPYMLPGCQDFYVRETRRVVVERQECVSTRYTETGWNSSRSYYEVRCENRQYVTYERFTPYEESTYVVVGIR